MRALLGGRRPLVGVVLGVVLLLAGCADKEPEPAAPAPAASSTTPAPGGSTTSRSGSTPTTSTTTALPGMPTPVSVGGSPVDASRLRATEDLAAAFGCPSAVPPIRLTASPAPSGGPGAPDAIVCASALADKEALFLWYTPTPEAKLAALTAAMDRARYVHAGPNWVAGGMINAQMGTVGGEVYR